MKIIRGKEIPYVPASHEDVNDPEVWKKVLFTQLDLKPGQIQMINWAKLPVGKKFRAHYHEDMEEIFIILSGRAKMRAGEEKAILERSDAVLVPYYAVHTMENVGKEGVEYLVIGITREGKGKTVVVST